MMTPPPADCFALLDDCHATAAAPSSRLYTGFVREHRCADPRTLDALWPAITADMEKGLNAVLLIDYEWGACLLQAGHEQLTPQASGALRLLMFAQLQRLSSAETDTWLAGREADELSTGFKHSVPLGHAAASAHPVLAPAPAPAGILNLASSVDRDAFANAISRIHAYIAEGDTYQINYTYRLHFRSFGAPVSLYRRLRTRQPVGFGAFIALPTESGGGHILSCSPELFLRNTGGKLEARPMKGTAPRAGSGSGAAHGDAEVFADRNIARRLGEDLKNRAENVMIVDLLRNDLGRIARTGSVNVPKLFDVERYATVFQMTSTVEAELASGTTFPDVLRALFPCGSITGAPKHRSMQIIANLENTPRGLYTGSIGWIDPARSPAQPCGDFCLSVGIRTLTLGPAIENGPDNGLYPGVMGVGAGIVIDSRAEDEFDECQLKARFLTQLDPGFVLFETLRVRTGSSTGTDIPHLDRHLRRLHASAQALGFAFDRAAIVSTLSRQCANLAPGHDYRLRLSLHHDGSTQLVLAALDPLPAGPVRLILQGQGPLTRPQSKASHSGSVPHLSAFIHHKTTLRHSYDQAIAKATQQGAFDMLFFNAAGQITEGARSNVFALIKGQWLTPPVSAGLLPGVMRSVLLDDPAWAAREAPLTLDDLRRADRIIVCNALRGPLDAILSE